jgi:hypothetical protein
LSSDPATPTLSDERGDLTTQAAIQEQIAPGHSLLGYFCVSINPATLEVTSVPVRGAAQHLNALKFIEPPTGGSLISFSNLTVTGQRVDLDVTIHHPFTWQHHYAGFDVKGVVIGLGDSKDNTDDTRYWGGGSDSLRLLNADGWTRWWNPLEFPDYGNIWSYRDGIYGTPKAQFGYNSTLLPYKVFASALGKDDDIEKLLDYPPDHPVGRSVFIAGTSLTRHYSLSFPKNGSGGPSLIFNYAVDACHAFPPGYVPGEDIAVPGGFPLSANQLEPFVVNVEQTENTLYLTGLGCVGGKLRLRMRIADWQALLTETPVSAQIQFIEITSPTLFNGKRSPSLVADSTESTPTAMYEIILEGLTPDSVENQQVLITIVSSEGDYQPDESTYNGQSPLSTFHVVDIPIDTAGPPDSGGFALNPLSPWPKPGGTIHNTNSSNAMGPSNPQVAWQVTGLSYECRPLTDPEDRVFVYREGEEEGTELVVVDSHGMPLAELEYTDFEPGGKPILVGCSMMWTNSDNKVMRLYQDGSLEEAYEPIPGVYESYTELNIDEAGHAFVHGPGGIQAFDQHGGPAWYDIGSSEHPYMYLGPSAINRSGLIVIGRVDINETPFVTDFVAMNPINGKVVWTHTPTCATGIAYGAAADPFTGRIYYAISGYLVALDEDGQQLWEKEFNHTVREVIALGPTGIAYAAETLYGVTGEAAPWRLFAYDKDGHEQWNYPCQMPIVAGPIVDNGGFIYIVTNLVGTNSTEAICLYPNGGLRWQKELTGEVAYAVMGPSNSLLIGFYESGGTTRVVALQDPS